MMEKIAQTLYSFFNVTLFCIFFSEVVLHQRLAADPEIITSQRYLSRDKKNGMNKMVTKMCKKYGFLEESAQFDPESVLAKVVFVRTHHMFSLILNFLFPLISKKNLHFFNFFKHFSKKLSSKKIISENEQKREL